MHPRLAAVALLSVASLAAVAPSAPAASGRSCSLAEGARVQRTEDGVTYSARLESLKARGNVPCASAKRLARRVMTRQISLRPIPTRLDGYHLMTVKPCAGCSPVFKVTAHRSGGSATFVFRGGA